MDILNLFLENPELTFQEIINLSQIPKTSVYRILLTLEEMGFVKRKRFIILIGFIVSNVWKPCSFPIKFEACFLHYARVTEVLGTFTVSMADHMAREEQYYLPKVAESTNTDNN